MSGSASAEEKETHVSAEVDGPVSDEYTDGTASEEEEQALRRYSREIVDYMKEKFELAKEEATQKKADREREKGKSKEGRKDGDGDGEGKSRTRRKDHADDD